MSLDPLKAEAEEPQEMFGWAKYHNDPNGRVVTSTKWCGLGRIYLPQNALKQFRFDSKVQNAPDYHD